MNIYPKYTTKPYVYICLMAILLSAFTIIGFAAAKSNNGGDTDLVLTDIELLGKYVFFDKISNPPRMACVTCHDPETGGTGSISGVNLHQVAITGANPHTVGNLKPPTNAYATFITPLHNRDEGCRAGVPGLCGGNFYNGRAEGEYPPLFPAGATKHIGDEIFFNTEGTSLGGYVWSYGEFFGPTADQALNPMPNTVEQNIDRLGVCQHVASSKYAALYERVWGIEIDCSDEVVDVKADDVAEEMAFDISFKRLMLAVCAWQASPDLNSFSSKRDNALRAEKACADSAFAEYYDHDVCVHEDYINSPGIFPLVGLTDQENLGHDLFYGIDSELNPDGKNANCNACHRDDRNDTGDELEQRYADDGYHNIGTPRNPEIPDTGADPDLGLKGLTGNERHRGFIRTPTIRNVDKRKGKGFKKAYTHNGWFKSMESIVHFYNTAAIGGETADSFGITRCPEGIETEKDALANNCWPEPAVSGNGPGSPAFPFLFGNLGLTLEDEAAIVAYMKTLSDEHTAKAPKPYKAGK